MATLNNIFVFVKSEEIDRSSKVPQHPVETGLPLTDNVRNEPKTLSIEGKIVNTQKLDAETIITKIENLRTKGSLVKYNGKNVVGNFLIKSFHTSDSNEVWGGCSFDMELVEVRIAKSAYNAKKSTTAAAASKPTLKVGAIVVFKGGEVFYSSDAKKATCTRGRQTCKITQISKASWSVHQYHLISTEKKYPNNVYGWVDVENIEGTGTSAGTGSKGTTTAAKTSGGTKQVIDRSELKSKTVEVYHTMKKGDKLKNLIANNYKDLKTDTGKPIDEYWVINHRKNLSVTYVHHNISVGVSTRLLDYGKAKKVFMGYRTTHPVNRVNTKGRDTK